MWTGPPPCGYTNNPPPFARTRAPPALIGGSMAARNKRPLQWHRECLESSRAYLSQKEAALRDAIADVERIRRAVEERARQLCNAEAAGLTEYDADKYGKPRAVRGRP